MSSNTIPTSAFMLAALAAAPAAAQTPITGDLFDIKYYVTDAAGERAREMDEADRGNFLNRARCECGQAVQVEIKATPVQVDNTKLVETLFGQLCAFAETLPAGNQFKRCPKLQSAVYPPYVAGTTTNVHPAWLAGGVSPESLPDRDLETATTAGSCSNPSGAAGVWICAQTNTTQGCQEDEFIAVVGSHETKTALQYDFSPPYSGPLEVDIEAAPGGARVSWTDSNSPGDIAGYRVLCEEVGTGAARNTNFPAPSPTAVHDGQHYYTAYNLCGGQPFSTVKQDLDPRSGAMCGDGVVDPDEACDDSYDNSDDGLCTKNCELAVSPALYGLDWGLVCSAHIAGDSNEAVLAGLEGGKTYDVVLVSYDKFGNPRAFPKVLQVTPEASDDEPGCGCRGADVTYAWLLLLPLLAASRRRR